MKSSERPKIHINWDLFFSDMGTLNRAGLAFQEAFRSLPVGKYLSLESHNDYSDSNSKPRPHIAVDWSTLFEDLEALTDKEKLTFEEAFGSLPVGKYVRIDPPAYAVTAVDWSTKKDLSGWTYATVKAAE